MAAIPVKMTKLFEPLTVGRVQLKHRIVMAPMTRFRADTEHVPLPIVKEYYSQRSHTPGTLLIAEATSVSKTHAGYAHYAGIWSDAQCRAWQEVTKEVHSKGCHIFLQLCGPGRTADTGFANLAPSAIPLSRTSSAIPIDEQADAPKAMTEAEIWECIGQFVSAAKNAVAAGFDGVELHGANGYLLDQFLQESCNQRSDSWGGSVENRARFCLELTRAVVEAIGADRVGYRISPWSTYLDVVPKDPVVQFSYLVRSLKEYQLAYLHVVESCVNNWYDVDRFESIQYILDIWDKHSPVIVAGGYTAETASYALEHNYPGCQMAVAFGRHFLSTPDLVSRIRQGLDPNLCDMDGFYSPETPKGYIDYPFAS